MLLKVKKWVNSEQLQNIPQTFLGVYSYKSTTFFKYRKLIEFVTAKSRPKVHFIDNSP